MITNLPNKIILHGVFLNVFGMGTLITGESGSGKSELALSLIQCGHVLIADDAPEFYKDANEQIIGKCPTLLRNFLAVRPLGILNVQEMFGSEAVMQQYPLQFIIHLSPEVTNHPNMLLEGSAHQHQNIFGVAIPSVNLLQSSIHLVAIAEAAVQQQILLQQGKEASEDLINAQKEQL
jgi:HPr kinase/phosphorylase